MTVRSGRRLGVKRRRMGRSRVSDAHSLVSYVPRSCREDWRKNDDKVNGKGTR